MEISKGKKKWKFQMKYWKDNVYNKYIICRMQNKDIIKTID